MSKQPVQPSWFWQLPNPDLRQDLEWLTPLTSYVERIANFGCFCSGEPFALLWVLDATEVIVVEKEDEHLTWPKEKRELLKNGVPHSMEGRSVEFITADMSKQVSGLKSDYFDLAYCENVLYDIHIESGIEGVQAAISTISGVVRSAGWIIAVEPKLGANYEKVPCGHLSQLYGHEIAFPQKTGDPVDMSHLFEASGLLKISLDETPERSYCYRKPPIAGADS